MKIKTLLLSLFILTPTLAQYNSSHTGAEIDAGIRPYKVYTALLSQTGTDAPVATVLENTLGGEVVWTRPSAGAYQGTLAGAFQSGKVYVTFAHFYDNGGVIEPIWVIVNNDYITIGGDNNVEMYDWRGAQSTGVFFQIEIRVYP